jgi:ribonuclease HI
MFETMKKDDLTRMLVTLWAIWHARRKAIHEEIYQSPMATTSFVNRFLIDLNASVESPKEKKLSNSGGTRKAKWIALPLGRVKVNVDAAVAKTRVRGAVATVFHSREGKFLGASAVTYEGITHPGALEALACREALDVADDALLGQVLVASDCLEVVKGLQEENLGVFSNILLEIKERARVRGNISFSHEKREFNGEAHNLARFASTLPEGRHLWLLEPPFGLNMPVILVTDE